MWMCCARTRRHADPEQAEVGRPIRVQCQENFALASRGDNNDTIDLAVLGGLKNKQALQGYQVVHFQPFDAVHKRTEATVTGADGKAFKVTKGAPQVILALSANAGQVKPAVSKAVNEFAVRGFRSLGVARLEVEGQWQFLGVLPLFDPPREDAKATIATARKMGVKIKMVTGDALAIAQETAKKLGMGAAILNAGSLGDSKKQETKAVAESIEPNSTNTFLSIDLVAFKYDASDAYPAAIVPLA